MTHTAPQTPLAYKAGNDAPVFDANILGELFNHDQTAIATVLKTFITSITESVSALVQADGLGDLATTGRFAHKIKGTSRLSGALAMGDIAAELETQARQGNAAAAHALVSQLETQWLLVQAIINPDNKNAA